MRMSAMRRNVGHRSIAVGGIDREREFLTIADKVAESHPIAHRIGCPKCRDEAAPTADDN
jgi:hypothetical protein